MNEEIPWALGPDQMLDFLGLDGFKRRGLRVQYCGAAEGVSICEHLV